MRFWASGIVSFILSTAAFPAFGADVAIDFNTTSNTAGNLWTYGHMPYSAGQGSTPDPSGFLLYDEAGTVVDPNAPFAWQDLAAGSVDTLGAVSFNETAQFKTFFGIDWEPMEVNFVPDQTGSVVHGEDHRSGERSLHCARRICRQSGYCCAGRESDAWVLSDSATLFHMDTLPASDPLLTHATGTARDWVFYDDIVSLSAGDSLYFASGKGPTG